MCLLMFGASVSQSYILVKALVRGLIISLVISAIVSTRVEVTIGFFKGF